MFAGNRLPSLSKTGVQSTISPVLIPNGLHLLRGHHAGNRPDLERAVGLRNEQIENRLVDPVLKRNHRLDDTDRPAFEVDARNKASDRALGSAVPLDDA
jgi:hypothetical protein